MNTVRKFPGDLHVTFATVVAMVGVFIATVFAISAVFADHPDPVGRTVQFVAGNPDCGDLSTDPNVIELKIQPVADGTYSDGTLTVTIDVRDTAGGPVFDWTSNIPIGTVFVKGGPNGNLYTYTPPFTSDTNLHAPVNPSNGSYYGLSHISFCYSPDATITIDPPTGVNEVGDPHPLTATVTTIGGDIATSGPNTPLCVTFEILSGPGSLTAPDDGNDCDGNGNNLDDCTIPGGSDTGSCSVTLISNAAGTTVVQACADVPLDTTGDGVTDLTLTRCTDGSSSNPAAEKVWVNALITLLPPTDTNFIHDTHDITCTIKINKGDGAGFVNAPDGTLCDAGIDSGPGSFVGSDTCALDGGDGNCIVTITSTVTGTTVVSACTSGLVVEGVLLSRCTDASAVQPGFSNGSPVTKTWVSGSVTLNKTFEVGPFTSPGQACFTLSRTAAPPPPISSDPLEQCDTGASLSFTWDDLIAGVHCIDETTVPAGYNAMAQICFTVDADHLSFSFDRNNPLQPGRLQVRKLLGPAGTSWTGPDVTFYVCRNDPPTQTTPEASCDASGPHLVDTIVIPADGNPAQSDPLEEAYYTVCEVVPAGYSVSPSTCQAVQVLSGETASANTVTFTNTPVGEGCTPGYWRQSQHLDDWPATGYAPNNSFHTAFGITSAQTGLSSSLTLLQAVSLGGGGSKVVARHGVAALLNAAHPDVDYPYTQAEVIAAVQAAFGVGSSSITIADLIAANEAGCPIS